MASAIYVAEFVVHMARGGSARTAARTANGPAKKSREELKKERKARRHSDVEWEALYQSQKQKDAKADDRKEFVEHWCPVCPNPMKGECKPMEPVPFLLKNECDHNQKAAFFAHRSCCCMLPHNNLRRVALWLATWKWFDRTVLTLIVLNTLLLTITDFSVVDPGTLSPVRWGTSTTYPFNDNTISYVNMFNFYIECVASALKRSRARWGGGGGGLPLPALLLFSSPPFSGLLLRSSLLTTHSSFLFSATANVRVLAFSPSPFSSALLPPLPPLPGTSSPRRSRLK